METEEPMTDGFSPEYVKEEIAKLMAYKIQAYEQLTELASLREQLNQLQEWKKSEIKLWSPILEYMQHNPRLKLGSSITETTLKVLKEYYDDNGLKEQLKEKDNWIAEEKTINRELGSSLNELEEQLKQREDNTKLASTLLDRVFELIEHGWLSCDLREQAVDELQKAKKLLEPQ